MTSSLGLRGWCRLQARRGVLLATTDEYRQQPTTDAREQNSTGPLHYV